MSQASGEVVTYGASAVYLLGTSSNTFSCSGTQGDLTVLPSNTFAENRQSMAYGRSSSNTGVTASAGGSNADSMIGFSLIVANP